MKRVLAVHLALWLIGGAAFRIVVAPPEACPPVGAAGAHASAIAAGDWLVANLDGGGRFTYGYDRDTGEDNPDYSLVRHAGATMSLFQLVMAGEDRYLEPADRALGYLLRRQFEHADWSAVADRGSRARLGVTGFVIVALLMRRDATGDRSYDELSRRLGRFVVAQQESSGALLAFWDPDTERPLANAYGPFATGEALWALVELDNRFPGEGWWEAADPTFRYLASGTRERNEGYLARLPDHWAAYALEAAGPERLDNELVDFARRLAGYFSLRLRIEAQRTGEGLNLWVRWYPGPPAGVGTAAEGMAALWRLSTEETRLDDLEADMAERMACGAGTMAERQVTEGDVRTSPVREVGAWFYRGYTQVDDQQHVLSGLLGAAQSLERQEAKES
ncbi:MAG: hypothetical protein QNJ88_00565 [Acidimicrobiia bacterium]|nr:hypothetical protein [Acidimicrobiia bacterium]